MTSLPKRATRAAASALLTLTLAACGGNDGTPPPAPGTSTVVDAASTTDQTVGQKFILGATVNAEASSSSLVVRAYGVLAGEVGPRMRVLVDGVEVGNLEVRATDPTDYRFSAPALKPGSKVDIAYTNDATVNGVDRNLFVAQLTAGDTYVLPTAASASLDRGSGIAAFDGIDTHPGSNVLPWNGALRLTWPTANLTSRMIVRASASLVDGVGPIVALRVDGVTVGSTEVRSAQPADHVFAIPVVNRGSRIDLVVANNAVPAGGSRALTTHYLRSGNTIWTTAAAAVTFDQGDGLAAFDGANVVPGQPTVTTNGALRGWWPASNMTDTLTVRAGGKQAGSVNPIMTVSLGGVELGSVEVASATLADYNFSSLPIQPGQQLDVSFANPGMVGSEVRRLDATYAISGRSYVLASNGSLRAAWPMANLTDTITVRAKGSVAAGVWPTMQLYVDGMKVGSTEVNSSQFADYRFAAPPMQAGRKVDVVFTNDVNSNGEDRNLFLAYLIAGNTYLVPGPQNASMDSGRDAAAFDGRDVTAGQPALFWSGALRMAWPEPNITDTVKVRASGTLAGNVGPILQLRVDGIAVSSVEVRSATPVDYFLPVPPLKPGSKIEAVFTNREPVGGVDRTLNVAYLLGGNTVLKPSTQGATYDAGTLRAAWPAANLTDTLAVRAYGVLAGNVGPVMQVLVDGVMVGELEVRATAPEDYRFAVPPLKPGTKIEVAYTNDNSVNGIDRNLYVTQLLAGKTFALPNAPGAVIDRGYGAAAFDGLDTVPGHYALVWGGALRLSWPEANLVDQITVRASGALAADVGPVMSLRVDGVTVGSFEVRESQPTDHVFATPALKPGARVDVVYSNDALIDGVDRNLNVHYLLAGGAVLLPSSSGVTYDMGAGLAAFDGADVQPGQVTLPINGALRGYWPAANMTETVTVRASGRSAGGVAPMMELRVGGVVLGKAEVRSTGPADYVFQSLPLKTGQPVEVILLNEGTVDGESRSLTVAYAIAAKTFLLATGGRLNALWPEPNLTETLTVRARGSLAANTGPVMQVFVDGVKIGSTEVRETQLGDYSFAAPSMQQGRKVDVVFTNDATINGEDRNLFLAYIVAGNTYVQPGTQNAVIDRGTGVGAFDGQDVVAGSGSIFWSGAVRTTWPAQNITGVLTVRASATLAGNIGALMQVRVDGVAVSSVEVRSSTPVDHLMPVPPLKPGSKVDLVFTNAENVGGVDRALNVVYAVSGNTYLTPTGAGVALDRGVGNAAWDGINAGPGQSVLVAAGALRMGWPDPNITDTIVVRARASLAANIGAMIEVRVNGLIVGTTEVRSTVNADYRFTVPRIAAGSKIDIAFTNDANIDGQDRNLFIQYVIANGATLPSVAPNVLVDNGSGESAFDGQGASASIGGVFTNGAMRFTAPAAPAADATLAAKNAASRFLQQATFGPTEADVNRLASLPLATWLNEQMAMPARADFVDHIQGKFDLGADYRPYTGINYTPNWVSQQFWATAAKGPDQLRKRVAFALHQIFMVSLTDSNLYYHGRAYASHLDTLNRHAFGNFRNLLEDIALSPAMGIYLSHMANRKEDTVNGRLPDENFAREVMQLFSIGLHELNLNGTPKLDGNGKTIETYSNADVMAMAKVFTGWSWAFPDGQLTEVNFRWGKPDYAPEADLRIDLQKMKPYPGQHSTAEKRLFSGKPHAVVIPASTGAQDSVRIALDTLFNHPNVGPFIGRQLIQRLVTSHPSAAYVARVASAFNNNGSGVRGDLGAVVRAVLLDPEARTPAADAVGKLREPVLRVTHWLRSFDARSSTGQYLMGSELDNQAQRIMNAPSVFGYFRPGYVPPNTAFSTNSITVPELQIVSESTTGHWVNMAMAMASWGIGWTGTAPDMVASLEPLVAMAGVGNVDGMIARLNLLLFAGRMSDRLRYEILESVTSLTGNSSADNINRARVALFLALSSPEFMVQR